MRDESLTPGTLVELFFEAVDRFTDRPAFRYFPGPGPELRSLSYQEGYEQAKAVAAGLAAAGLRRGDRAAILAENRPEWALADYGCLCAGVEGVPIYSTLTASQVAYILKDSGARLVFASTQGQMEKTLEASREAGVDVTLVVFDDVADAPAGVLPWTRFTAVQDPDAASDERFREAALAARPEDVATILYTSGTTGQPKGVMLAHNNLHSNVVAAGRVLPITDQDTTLSFLPLSHVLQRMVDFLLFSRGCTIAYAHSLKTVADDLKVVRPTLAVSVPRLYEKVYNTVMEQGGLKGKLVRWAREVGTAWTEETLAGRKPTAVLQAVHALADRLVYRKIRQGLGGRLRFFVSGGAPLEPAINKFFYGAGVVILEGYGLTETSPVTNVNNLEQFKIGTVGPPVPGTEIRIAPDGEILVRGPQVMKGYYKLPEETAQAIDAEGWFRTGDIGEIDEDDFLRITDRKKDLIVTAGGKNVAPQPIENRLKTNPLVEQDVMVGDRKKFVALLVVPSFPVLETWARANGVPFADREELVGHPRVQEKMAQEVLGGLDDLASYEKPKKLALLTDEFSIENGTLTPTQKVKRRVVQDRFADLIGEFYREENAHRSVLVAAGRDGG